MLQSTVEDSNFGFLHQTLEKKERKLEIKQINYDKLVAVIKCDKSFMIINGMQTVGW